MDSFDDSLKYLVDQQPGDFIAFGLGQPRVEVVRSLSLSLPSRGRDLDDAFLVRISGRLRVAHLEYDRRHQSRSELAADIAEAQVRLFRREGVPVVSQVWDLYGRRKADLLSTCVLKFGAGCRSTYHRVNLRALGWRDLMERAPPALWPLAPLTRDGAAKEAVGQVRDAIQRRQDLPAPVRADHLAVLLFMAEAEGLPLQVLKAYIGETMLMQSQLYREIFEKGEAKGEARGEAKRQADSLIRVLMRRFNYVDDALSRRLRTETRLDVLETWFDEALMLPDEPAMLSLVQRIQKTPLPQPQ